MDSTIHNYLLYWRKRRNLSLEKLSTRMGIDGNFASAKTLNRWEKSQTTPPEWAIEALAKALKITSVELLQGPRDPEPTMPIEVSAAYTGLDFEIAENVISMGYTSWLASRPLEARKAVETVLPWLETARRRAPLSIHAHHSSHLLARGYELLGALELDKLENDTAISYFRRALTLSEELKDTNLIAAHMTELGDAYRRKGDKEIALDFMKTALHLTQNAERATRGYVLEILAYTYADTNNEQAFHRYIEDAVQLLGHSGEGSGAGNREFIPFEVLEIYGKAMRDFGHPVQSLQYLQKAEQALISRPHAPRWRALLTISKAQALCDAGELEEGVRLAIDGMTLAHSCYSPRQMNRVRKLMRKLDASPYHEAPVLSSLREIVKDVYVGDRNPLNWQPRHMIS